MSLQVYYILLILHLATSYDRSFGIEIDPKIGPKGMPFNKTTSCKEFGKYARFNPHSIVGSKWLVFYYWAPPMPTLIYDFWIPSKNDMMLLHSLLDGHVPKHFNWSSPMMMMMDVIQNATTLLVERGDRGQYWAVSIYKGMPEGHITDYHNIRIKQTGNNKYIGFMDCYKETAFILCRISGVPRKKRLQEEALTLGYIGRKGKSYLYEGHEWMPIPEQNEYQFWRMMRMKPGFQD